MVDGVRCEASVMRILPKVTTRRFSFLFRHSGNPSLVKAKILFNFNEHQKRVEQIDILSAHFSADSFLFFHLQA